MPVTDDLTARFEQALAGLAIHPEHRIGLAVSGGGDSIAMMHLAARILDADKICVLTVDHGLRPEAATEIALVARQAKALGLQHAVAKWTWDGHGNLQAAARSGRWCALVDMAAAHQLDSIWMAHTQDDQIETAMMRLARGSGVDGLAAMKMQTMRDGMRLARPLLNASRADLHAWLVAQKIDWCDDPSNDDPQFDRVRARQMFEHLQDLGLTRKRVLQMVDHMRAAQISLHAAASDFAAQHVTQEGGDLICDLAHFDLGSTDVARRVMAASLMWVSGKTYRPRFEQMGDAVTKTATTQRTTFSGCLLSRDAGNQIRITREAAATVACTCESDAALMIWDARWQISGPFKTGMVIKALGDDIKQCPVWRETGLPRRSLTATPAIWSGDTLIAAPVAGFGADWTAQIATDFHSSAFAIED